jgi:peptide/nickel transport system substrate-binding protein
VGAERGRVELDVPSASGHHVQRRTPLDAEAVKANYVRTITIELGTQFILGSFLPKPEKQIVVEDPQTIRFDLAYPYPHFDVVMAAQYGTGLVSPKVFEEHSTGETDQGHEYLLSHAVGTGPYVLDTLEPGNQVVLTRNEDYWRGWDGPHFDTIIIRSIPEASTRRQLLESGDVDIAYAGTARIRRPCGATAASSSATSRTST